MDRVVDQWSWLQDPGAMPAAGKGRRWDEANMKVLAFASGMTGGPKRRFSVFRLIDGAQNCWRLAISIGSDIGLAANRCADLVHAPYWVFPAMAVG